MWIGVHNALSPFADLGQIILDPDASLHFARIAADGGSVTNPGLISGIIADLKAGGIVDGTAVGNCYDKLDWMLVPGVCSKTDLAGYASKVYDLSPSKGASFGTSGYYDAVQTTATLQHRVVAGIDGIPAIGGNASPGAGYIVNGSIQAVWQPTAAFVVSIREGEDNGWQFFFDSSLGGADRQCFSYQTGGTIVEMFAGTLLNATTNPFTWGVFGSFVNGASSNTKRGNTIVATGDAGGNSRGSRLSFLNRFNFSNVWGGRCSFFATTKVGITQAERDFIQSVLLKYSPSAV